MGSVTLVKRTIDWDKVTGFDDIKAILIAMDLEIKDIPDNPDHQVAGIRYLLHPLPGHADGTY